MTCDWVRDNATLYVYDELPDDERYEFERHLERCAGCREEVEAVRAFRRAMTAGNPVPEPSANLLTASRMRLQEALESAPRGAWWHRLTFDVAGWMHQMKLSPALTAVLLMVGFTGGAATGYRLMNRPDGTVADRTPAAPVTASIAGIRGISEDPRTKTVQVEYDRLVPDRVEGSVDDPRIRQLLLLAAQSRINPGVRVDSIDLLAKNSDDSRVREALVRALRTDKNAGVRLKALDGLKPYVADDTRVRDAVLEALMHDENPGVRSEAISMLKPVEADTSVRNVLNDLAKSDQDSYIRTQSRRVLASLPSIE